MTRHGCDGKRTYLTFAAAALAARQICFHRAGKVHAYHCPGCHKFHVGGLEQDGREWKGRDFKRRRAALKSEGEAE